MVINSSIIAGNKITGTSTRGIDLYSTTTVSLAGNNSLIGTNDNSSITLTGTFQAGTNASPINPLLAPLTDQGGIALPNGQRIKTLALLPGSPAIDMGNNAPINAGVSSFTFDEATGKRLNA